MPSDRQSIKPAGPQHEAFIAWSEGRGVKINGVQPATIPGCGLGIVARRCIEPGEEIVTVPASALLTEQSIPVEFKAKFEDITIHGLLASFLASNHPQLEHYQTWAATWPTPGDFKNCMPMLWPKSLCLQLRTEDFATKLCSMLPPAIRDGHWADDSSAPFCTHMSRGLLHAQESKFSKALVNVKKVFPSIDVDWYKYCWLVVNTRTFYYELPGLNDKRSKDDCMVMCPFVDLFNHADEGCDVAFDENEYTVTTKRAYDPGEEIHVSYGSHSNDFLLVEYGFILEENKWDYVPIDDLLVPDVLGHKLLRNKLERVGYLGNYSLSSDGVCYRTQVAIRAMTAELKEFKKFVSGHAGSNDARAQSSANSFIKVRILQRYETEAKLALHALGEMDDENLQLQKQTLMKRWAQIEDMVQRAREMLPDQEHESL